MRGWMSGMVMGLSLLAAPLASPGSFTGRAFQNPSSGFRRVPSENRENRK